MLSISVIVIVVLICTTPSNSQAQDVSTLSYQAFNQLAVVYQFGGSAPTLVARLNSALALIAEARTKRTQGDEPNAIILEGQARTILEQALPEIAPAQQEALQATRLKTQTLSAEGALVVLLLTIAFYGCLRTWKWYEKEELYEMRIVAKEIED